MTPIFDFRHPIAEEGMVMFVGRRQDKTTAFTKAPRYITDQLGVIHDVFDHFGAYNAVKAVQTVQFVQRTEVMGDELNLPRQFIPKGVVAALALSYILLEINGGDFMPLFGETITEYSAPAPCLEDFELPAIDLVAYPADALFRGQWGS